MSFTDHKITQFQHRIADLPDEPQLPAADLKSRFDACPEELRQAHNALCDDADRLDDRVSGIIAETFGDTISKSMLSDELAAELDAKAVETSVASRINALDTRVDTLETTVPQKCECFFGTYTGNGQNNQKVQVGFQPKAVLVIDPVTDTSTTDRLNFCGLGLQGNPVDSHIKINNNGFSISIFVSDNKCLNKNGNDYIYIAFR